ncbi:MAG: type IV secretion system DNA-binding domain-containing protein [Patescibacteria group bacterium]|nr:type IV secretion system DNA-binding domain-containing protein [Patescibacteria group bacterium]
MFNDKAINFFARTDYRNKERIFGIKADDRRRHMYVIGKTGMGKTNMIQNMAIQDIRNGKGVAIVDPHGEFANECLKAVPSHRINDVIYFNPADTAYPIAMNIMEKVDPECRHLVASGLVGVFKKIWADSWGPRLEYLLRNAILALLEDPTSTLLGVNRILVDKVYRAKVLENVTDPVVHAFWTDEFAKYHDRLLTEAIAPIQNKVGQFLSSALIRNIVGQTNSTFDIREVMDNEKIIIMNLSKGRIGEDNSALLGAMMITKIQLAIMARIDMPEQERRDFYLYVDEFQNFATDSFKNILSEARKYKLNLILAHQYITQLDETVRDAVFGNVGTIISFRIGAMDSETLEKEFEPTFYANDLVNLTKYHIYLKLMIDGIATNPFSAATIEPINMSGTEQNMEKIIRLSRERYGTPREIVEKKINSWSGMLSAETKNNIDNFAKQQHNTRLSSKTEPALNVSNGNIVDSKWKQQQNKSEIRDDAIQPRPNIKEEYKMHDSKCWGCGMSIQIPFEPDGVRPVFCKDCLKSYRREQVNLQQQLRETEQAEQNRQQNRPQNYSQNSQEVENQDNFALPEQERRVKDIIHSASSADRRQSRPEKQKIDKDAVRELISKALKDRAGS